jgi:predicted secreted hydrolase
MRALVLVLLLLSACAGRDDEAPVQATLRVGELLGGGDTLHERALEPRAFAFPDDHGEHPAFRTEWWYYTGNLATDDGREFGYQLTFFRTALADSAAFVAAHPEGDARSAWRTRHAYMAHFAVSDVAARRLHAAQRFARGAAGLAGASARPFAVWTDTWRADGAAHTDGKFPLRLVAADGDVAIDLVLERGRPMVLQGDGGLSRKGPEPGNASYYYSFMRMPTRGTVRVDGREYTVTGDSWLDREWSTSALSPDLVGWDWMALRLDDGSDLMLYHLRRRDGSAGPFSAGTFVGPDGRVERLDAAAFRMTPVRRWSSPLDATLYPVSWTVEIPSLRLQLRVDAAFDAQELNLAVRYWEGAVRVEGTRGGARVSGRGYLEMTGYDARRETIGDRR